MKKSRCPGGSPNCQTDGGIGVPCWKQASVIIKNLNPKLLRWEGKFSRRFTSDRSQLHLHCLVSRPSAHRGKPPGLHDHTLQSGSQCLRSSCPSLCTVTASSEDHSFCEARCFWVMRHMEKMRHPTSSRLCFFCYEMSSLAESKL